MADEIPGENLYAPPQAAIDGREHLEKKTAFFVVAPRKLIGLYIISMGIYGLGWFYMHWQKIKQQEQSKIWPPARAIFSMFFTHALFQRVDQANKDTGKVVDWNFRSQAWLYVVMVIISSVVDRIAEVSGAADGVSYVIWSGIGMFAMAYSVVPLAKAQGYMNELSGDELGTSNQTYNAGNWILVALGVLLWGLILLGFLTITGLLTVN